MILNLQLLKILILITYRYLITERNKLKLNKIITLSIFLTITQTQYLFV